MVLLCNLLSYVTDNPLVITAIITFVGVAIAACLNYTSSIKANKSKIKIEEAKLKYAFTKECFDALAIASKTLKHHGNLKKLSGKCDKKYLSELYDMISAEINVYVNILPFIDNDEIKGTQSELAKMDKHRLKLHHTLELDQEPSTADEENVRVLSPAMIKIRSKYVKIIDRELIEVGKKLRSFKID